MLFFSHSRSLDRTKIIRATPKTPPASDFVVLDYSSVAATGRTIDRLAHITGATRDFSVIDEAHCLKPRRSRRNPVRALS
jgi:hypothetical protein